MTLKSIFFSSVSSQNSVRADEFCVLGRTHFGILSRASKVPEFIDIFIICGTNMQQMEIRSVLDSETYIYLHEPLKLLDSEKVDKSRNRYYHPHFPA